MTFGNLASMYCEEHFSKEQRSVLLSGGLTAAEHLLEVKSVFGRTTPRLHSLFGVSRETFSKWLDGSERPAAFHEALLHELALAARVFLRAGIRPTATMFDKTVAKGKTFLQLLRQGEAGEVVAGRLVRIIERDELSGKKLDAALRHSPKVRVAPEDFGSPAFEKDF